MAIKTGLWVSAHLRRCHGEGLTGVVARRGAEEAGSVFVRVIGRDGLAKVFGPAPGPAYDEAGGRRWRALTPAFVTITETDALLARQIAFDPDIWIVDIDDPRGTGLLDMVVS